MRVRRVALAFLLPAWAAAACGAFSLDDVVPAGDGDSGPPADGGPPVDGSAHDGGTNDGASPPDTGSPDADAAPAPCDAGGDPCACIPAPTLVSAGNGAIENLRLDSTYAYWLATTGGNPSLYRAPLDGDGAPPEQLSGPLSIGSNSDFAVGPGYVYLVLGNTFPILTAFPLDGGPKQNLTNVLPDLPVDLGVTSEAFYWTNDEAAICTAALDGALPPGDSGCGGAPLSPPQLDGGFSTNHLLVGNTAFWLSVQKTGELRRVPLAGGPGALFATLGGNLSAGLAGTDTDVYWADQRPDAAPVFHESADGGNPDIVADETTIAALAVDAVNVYVIAGTAANKPIVEVPLSGAAPRVLACDANVPNVLALDATYVYWTNSVGEVKRVAK